MLNEERRRRPKKLTLYDTEGGKKGKGEGEAKLNGRRGEEVQEVKSSEEPASGVQNRTDREKTRHG